VGGLARAAPDDEDRLFPRATTRASSGQRSSSPRSASAPPVLPGKARRDPRAGEGGAPIGESATWRVVDPLTSDRSAAFAQAFYALRQRHGISWAEALYRIRQRNTFAP